MKWKCPKCKREFEKKGQTHSCTVFPLEKHFNGKENARQLYEKLKGEIEKKIGPIKVESLPCCIHWVSNYSFAGVYALKEKIRVHFTLDYKLESKRIENFSKISAKKFLYSVEIAEEKDIDNELISWLKQSYNLKKKN